MNKIKKLLVLLAVAPLFLGSCIRNNGYCSCDESTVKDENNDGYCDICGLPIVGFCHHEDKDEDGYCDICGHDMNEPEGGGSQGGGDQGGGDQGGGGSQGGGGQGGGGQGGGGSITPDNPPIDPNVEVTTYLVLSSVGLYKENADTTPHVGLTIGAKHLENAIAFVALPGAALPGADNVVHKNNSGTFSRWLCYEGEGEGAPRAYTTVPYANDKILYAEFVANGNTPTPDPDPIPDPTIPVIDTTSYYLNTSFSDGSGGNWDVVDAQVMWAHVWNGSDNRDYQMHWDSVSTYWKVDIPKDTYTSIIFLRVKVGATSIIWDGDNKTVPLYGIGYSLQSGLRRKRRNSAYVEYYRPGRRRLLS